MTHPTGDAPAASERDIIKEVADALAMDALEQVVREGREELDFRRIARVALKALHKPTPAMRKVGTVARWQSAVRDANNVGEIWMAMIDEAMREGE